MKRTLTAAAFAMAMLVIPMTASAQDATDTAQYGQGSGVTDAITLPQTGSGLASTPDWTPYAALTAVFASIVIGGSRLRPS